MPPKPKDKTASYYTYYSRTTNSQNRIVEEHAVIQQVNGKLKKNTYTKKVNGKTVKKGKAVVKKP